MNGHTTADVQLGHFIAASAVIHHYPAQRPGARTMMTTTKAERETILRWDQEERVLHLYTAYPAEARKWARLGYSVEVSGRTQSGEPRGWRARAPLEALRLRRLVNGKVIRHRRGRGFAGPPRKLAGADLQPHTDGETGPSTVSLSPGSGK